MSSNLMNIERGGEGDQYEDSVKTVTQPRDKQSGQLGGDSSSNGSSGQVSDERGNQTAENIRSGQKLSEEGMGGKTTSQQGEANQDGYGNVKAQEDTTTAAETRREQGYGPGSGVGA